MDIEEPSGSDEEEMSISEADEASGGSELHSGDEGSEDEAETESSEEEVLEPKVLPNRTTRASRLEKVGCFLAKLAYTASETAEKARLTYGSKAENSWLRHSFLKRRIQLTRTSGTKSFLPRKTKIRSSRLLNQNKKTFQTATSASR